MKCGKRVLMMCDVRIFLSCRVLVGSVPSVHFIFDLFGQSNTFCWRDSFSGNFGFIESMESHLIAHSPLLLCLIDALHRQCCMLVKENIFVTVAQIVHAHLTRDAWSCYWIWSRPLENIDCKKDLWLPPTQPIITNDSCFLLKSQVFRNAAFHEKSLIQIQILENRNKVRLCTISKKKPKHEREAYK